MSGPSCSDYSDSSNSDSSDSEKYLGNKKREMMNLNLKKMSQMKQIVQMKKKKVEIDLVELMISQDPLDGFWNKNEETIKVEKSFSKNIVDNINKII